MYKMSVSISALLSRFSIFCKIQKKIMLSRLKFVTVVYEDFHGIRRPIGLVHKVKLGGQLREVFTFCCAGKRQPGMALFVRNRTGDLADQVALSFDDQHIIPAWLKHLPEEYKDQYFQVKAA